MEDMGDVREYSAGFKGGFEKWRTSKDLADVLVRLEPCGQEEPLHGLLLARASEYFARSLNWGRTTGDQQQAQGTLLTIRLTLGDALLPVWPHLVGYFYTDAITLTPSNVMPLLSLSRLLLCSAVESYCLDFLSTRLNPVTCIPQLRLAVMLALDDVGARCTHLMATSMHALWASDVAGLPPNIITEILSHPELSVACEQQVLHFVLQYLATTHVADPADVHAICQQIRFPYLSNALLSALGQRVQKQQHHSCTCAESPSPVGTAPTPPSLCGDQANARPATPTLNSQPACPIPRSLLLESALTRLELLDRAGAGVPPPQLSPPPRTSYCCSIQHGLPGGCTWVDVDLGTIWAELLPHITPEVSGLLEGHASHLLSAGDNQWLETNDSQSPLPWVQVTLPSNVRILNLTRLTFQHGHRRAGYYRARNLRCSVASEPTLPLIDLYTRVVEGLEVQVAGGPWGSPPQALSYPEASTATHPLHPLMRKMTDVAAAPPPPLMGVPSWGHPTLAPDGSRVGNGGSSSSVYSQQQECLMGTGLLEAAPAPPASYRVVRVQALGAQEDGVYRLCIKSLKLAGTARIDLMSSGSSFVWATSQAVGVRANCTGTGTSRGG